MVYEARIYVRLNTSCDETEYAEVFRELKPETGECSLPVAKSARLKILAWLTSRVLDRYFHAYRDRGVLSCAPVLKNPFVRK